MAPRAQPPPSPPAFTSYPPPPPPPPPPPLPPHHYGQPRPSESHKEQHSETSMPTGTFMIPNEASPSSASFTFPLPQAQTSIPSSTKSNQPKKTKPPKIHHTSVPVGVLSAAAAIAAVIAVFVIIGLCIVYIRRQRRRKLRAAAVARAASAKTGEMSIKPTSPTVTNTRAYLRSPPPVASPTTPTSASTVPTTQSSRQSQQPVILTTTMDRSYLTGIDTSDHISLADNRSQSSGEYPSSVEEPPPPYRPRSVPPISRENSVLLPSYGPRNSIRGAPPVPPISRGGSSRISNSAVALTDGATRSSIAKPRISTGNEEGSPFQDPEGEESPTPTERAPSTRAPSASAIDADRMSIASELSIQQEPTTVRSSL